MRPSSLPRLLHLGALHIAACALALTLPAHAQVHASESPAPHPAQPSSSPPEPSAIVPPAPAAGTLGGARVFPYDQMPVRTAANGTQSRTITHGTLASGESVNLHESTQPPGIPPVDLHVIHHTEFICVLSGELDFEHTDPAGKTLTERAGPGSVIYVALGTNHRIHNVGTTPAQYIVVAIGGDAR